MDFLNNYFKYQNKDVICGLTDELNVLFVLNLFKKEKKNVILLTSTLYEASNYYNLLQTYTEDALLFLMDDFVSFKVNSMSPELKLTRLNTLEKINNGHHIIVTNLMAYLKYLPNKEEVDNQKLVLKNNIKIKRDLIISKLIDFGYHKESLTTTTGEFSVRGMIIDIFLINESSPIRIEMDDDVVESIRYFDEDTQLTTKKTDEIIIKPIEEIKSNKTSSLYDYLSDPYVIKIDNKNIDIAYHKLYDEIIDYQEKENISNKLMYDYDEIKIKNEIVLNKFISSKNDILYESKSIDNFNEDFDLLEKNILLWNKQNKEVIFYLSKENEIKKIKKLFPGIKIINKKINKGFIFDKYVIISEYDIENINRNYKYQNNFYGGKKIVNYNDLNIGDYVVHIAHGIGQYNGVKTLTKNGVKKDYIEILYKGSDKIYIPTQKITNIYKYSDKDGTVPKLNAIDSVSWLKTKKYVQSKVKDISKKLIELYKKRALISSPIYKSFPEEDIFASEFNYTLTSDQQKSINDIFNDLSSSHPMDRLLCGDVGFGKTEVALRAIFKAIVNNFQVMYLCPTTILSSQQYKVAKDRFASWPIEIELLNRFTSTKKEKEIIDRLEKGTIDVIFGTHKLLNNKIKFKKLGLLIVDEEQRFGVTHKEKIKELKNDINVLTLSATPIPRTLKMALSGLRDLSIIDTPPKNRYPVQTYVVGEDDYIIKDAIYKELSRGGQIFILFNNIENIETKIDHLRNIIPNEHIEYIHGRMDKNAIENIMEDFINHKFNILLCTTIIENGIDIPNVNTLIIYDADKLGLAQLYQLRGRVGRSDKVAYAYLMYNSNKMLNDIAIKRLNAIKEFTELGSGYKIAMRDLSIRGSGDIFGSSQAGYIDSVGISLYMKLLEDEIKRQKGEIVEEEDNDDKELLNVDTHIDDDYVSDNDIKIEIHEMISNIDSYDKLKNVKNILIDRFGKISDDLENYMYECWFEKIARRLKIRNVKQTDRYIEIELPKELSNNIKGDKLLYEATSITRNFNLAYHHNNIIITLYYKNLEDHFIKYIVKLLNTI